MSALAAVRTFDEVQQCRPGLMISILIFSDIAALSMSGAATLLLKWLAPGNGAMLSYFHLFPLVLLFVAVFAALGLYSGVPLSSPEELRRSTLACIAISMCIIGTRAFIRGSHLSISWTNLAAILLSIAVIPIVRELVRLRCARQSWWGYPVVIFGDVAPASRLLQTLHRHLDIGLKPIAVLATSAARPLSLSGVPVIAEHELPRFEHALSGRGYAVFAGNVDPNAHMLDVIAANRTLFPHVLIVPQIWEFSCFRVVGKNVGGLFGLEIRDKTFAPGKQFLKRVLDLTLTILLLIALAPLFLAVIVAQRLESEGPVFYRHLRIGRGGIEFRAWKFRSMVQNADAALAQHLAKHPEQAEEWRINQKLRQDPRVTRVGRLLRRTSMDELPQLWNVLRGEMSLVGPRPIVRDEICRYGKHFSLYKAVQGGLTGLWQVSGRSETSYEQRVAFDTFYVRNWSVWLDLCILFRTIAVICLRTGAY